MSNNDGSDNWWQLSRDAIERLTYLLGGGVLVSVFVALALGQWGNLPDSDATFYVTEIAIPLLTFTGFLAVYLGFRSQEEQNELQEKQLRKQQENFQKDRFESTFFQLLRTHNQIVEDVRVEKERKATRYEGVEQGLEAPSFYEMLLNLEKGKRVTIKTSGKDIQILQMWGRSCLKSFI